MEEIRHTIARLLFVGIIISSLFIMIGGCLYLIEHGNNIVNYQQFHGEPILLTSVYGILRNAFSFAPIGIIQLGLLMLYFVQILRVALTAWYFMKEKSVLFSGISLFILFILIATLLWNL